MGTGFRSCHDMKSSGVEWMEEIPEHWMVLPNWKVLEDTSNYEDSNLDKSEYNLGRPNLFPESVWIETID